MREYVTVSDTTVCETVIDRSRFIAAAVHVDSAEAAQAFVEERRKKFYDATHNCYAYVVGDKAKFSDDGEPQGTAGMPIYETIRQNGLDCVCVVVTRYFGGIKLGAGGLVRAYGGSCAEVLRKAPRVRMTDCIRMAVTADYTYLKTLRKALEPHAVEEEVTYGEKVCLVYLFPAVLLSTITDIVSENTLGKGDIEVKERLLAHFAK